jgi:hypothetical protein
VGSKGKGGRQCRTLGKGTGDAAGPKEGEGGVARPDVLEGVGGEDPVRGSAGVLGGPGRPVLLGGTTEDAA